MKREKKTIFFIPLSFTSFSINTTWQFCNYRSRDILRAQLRPDSRNKGSLKGWNGSERRPTIPVKVSNSSPFSFFFFTIISRVRSAQRLCAPFEQPLIRKDAISFLSTSDYFTRINHNKWPSRVYKSRVNDKNDDPALDVNWIITTRAEKRRRNRRVAPIRAALLRAPDESRYSFATSTAMISRRKRSPFTEEGGERQRNNEHPAISRSFLSTRSLDPIPFKARADERQRACLHLSAQSFLRSHGR